MRWPVNPLCEFKWMTPDSTSFGHPWIEHGFAYAAWQTSRGMDQRSEAVPCPSPSTTWATRQFQKPHIQKRSAWIPPECLDTGRQQLEVLFTKSKQTHPFRIHRIRLRRRPRYDITQQFIKPLETVSSPAKKNENRCDRSSR